MLTINSSVIILMSCSIIVVYGIIWWKHQLLFNRSWRFSREVFHISSFVFFPYHSCNFCNILSYWEASFLLRKKSFIKIVFFYTNFNFNSLIICNIKVLNIVIFSVVLNPLLRKTLNQCSLVSNFDFLGINSFVAYETNLS